MNLFAATLVSLVLSAAPSDSLDRDKIESQISSHLKYPTATGLMVYHVASKSQAEKSGVKIGDILTQFDGQPVTAPEEISTILRNALNEKRPKVIVTFNRGKQDMPVEMDPAPIGVRLFPVKIAEPKTLWHKATRYEPDFTAINKLLQDCERFELLMQDNQVVGWSRQFFVKQNNLIWMRNYWRLKTTGADEKRDILVSFEQDKYLTMRSAWMMNRDKLVLQVVMEGKKMQGAKASVRVESELMSDTVNGLLSGLVATTMPRKAGACLRCSYMDSGALTPAPFADLYCAGEVPSEPGTKSLGQYRFDQSVFGQSVHSVIVDSQGQLVRTRFGKRFSAETCNRAKVAEHFPAFESEFGPIDRFPNLHRSPLAN